MAKKTKKAKRQSFRALVRGMKTKHRASTPKRRKKMTSKHDDDDDKKLGHAKPKPVGSKTPGGGEVEPPVSLDQPGEVSPPPNPPEEKKPEEK